MATKPRKHEYVRGYHCYDPSRGHDKVYVLAIAKLDDGLYQLQGWYAARTRNGMMPMQSKGMFSSMGPACDAMAKCIIERGKKGYQDVESAAYFADTPVGYRVTMNQLLAKIDTSRIPNLNAPAKVKTHAAIPDDLSNAATPSVTVTTTPPPVHKGPARAARSLSV